MIYVFLSFHRFIFQNYICLWLITLITEIYFFSNSLNHISSFEEHLLELSPFKVTRYTFCSFVDEFHCPIGLIQFNDFLLVW